MKKLLAFIVCAVLTVSLVACSVVGGAGDDAVETPTATIVPAPTAESVPAEPPKPEPIEYVEIYSAKMWNEFARSYNGEREKYADYITVEITSPLDFEDMAFVPLTDGFSGRISSDEGAYSQEQRREWIATRKKWPQDYSGTFMNITVLEEVKGKIPTSLFGNVAKLELENLSFALVYLDDAKSMLAENADVLSLRKVRVQNCTLPAGRSILALNVGELSVDDFIAESCVLTGYEYMAGLAAFVEGDAEFKDVFMCRCSFNLSPDNGGSGLWGAGIGVLAKQINGTAYFENIDLYACNATGLYTNALTGSAGSVAKCSNISLELCAFINYRHMASAFNSGLITSCGENSVMEMPIFEENVSIKNCNIGGEYTTQDFTARGYHVENCVFVSGMDSVPHNNDNPAG